MTPVMLLAAAKALAGVATDDELDGLHHAERLPR